MAGQIRDKTSKLKTREARSRLTVGDGFHWASVAENLHVGYRKRRGGKAGTWAVREYLGEDHRPGPDGKMRRQGRYRTTRLGVADDDGDGLSFYQARDAVKALVEERRDGPSGDVTVADAIAAYVASMRARGAATADEVKRQAERVILPVLGHRLVADLSTGDLNRWRDGLATSPAIYRGGSARPTTPRARRASANRVATQLKAALNHAFREGAVASDAAWGRSRFRPLPEAETAKVRYLTSEEVTRFLNASSTKSGFRDLARAALETGARYGELPRLRVRDFNGEVIAIATSKSGKARSIDLSPEAVSFFQKLTVGKSPSALLLPRHCSSGELREWRKGDQTREVDGTCDIARIEPRIGFHILRHTWASLAVMGGMPIPVVSRVLGHASTAVTERHYAHLAPSFVAETVRRFAPRYDVPTEAPSNVVGIKRRR